jgi:serine protease Do
MSRSFLHRRSVVGILLLSAAACFVAPWWSSSLAAAEADRETAAEVDLEALFAGGTPSSAAELRAMERHQRKLAKKLAVCTVAVVVGPAHGSGVIISRDGLVLTAAHVAGKPNREATIRLADGRRVKAKTLGVYRTLDAGLMKITEDGPWPHAELAEDSEIEVGQWVLATGHPGGFESGRQPVLRVGRVLLTDKFAITTDCALIGGDSGGPLFDMQGRVIGVNSRIGRFLTANMHVPVAAYHDNWDRLVKGDSWGHFPLPGGGPYIGVVGDANSNVANITAVRPGTPAEKAGLQPGDIVLSFAGKPISDFESLQLRVNDCDPGERVVLTVQREEEIVEIELTVGSRKPRMRGNGAE